MKLEFNFNQSGVIPYRIINGEIEILLITSVTKKKWIIPKGYVEFNLSPFESAKKEAIEEAGVLGGNETFELGEYHIKKKTGMLELKIYTLEVTEELKDYQEMNVRSRKWFSLNDAIEKVSIREIKEMLKTLPQKIR